MNRVALRSFSAELRRRGVYKIGVSYTAIGWLLIQIATQLFPFFEVPSWIVRLIVVLLVIGFPVALVLAWAFEITPEGIQRKAGPASANRVKDLGIYAVVLAAMVVAGLVVVHFLRTQLATPIAASPALPAPPAIPEKSIAVLPLENLSEEKDNDFFADGIQDDVLGSLARIKSLKVISRSSVMSYRDVSKRNLKEIGEQLGVANILEGSVRRRADRVLVSVHLVATRDSREVWAERYDRTLANVLTLQGELATEIAAALSATLSPEEKTRVEAQPTDNPEAYLLYLRARGYETRPGWDFKDRRTAITFYTEAIAQAPGFALAHARLSALLTILYINKEPTPEIAQRARAEAEAAVRLQPDLGEGHLARALCIYRLDRDYPAALSALEAAAPLLPSSSEIVLTQAYIHRRQGQWRRALTEFETAFARDPRNGQIAEEINQTQSAVRNWPAAVRAANLALSLTPDSATLKVDRANLELFGKGDLAPLRTALASVRPEEVADGSFTAARCDVALLARDFYSAEQAIAGHPAASVLTEFQIAVPPDYFRGIIALANGETARARELLKTALPSFESEVTNLPLDPLSHATLGQLYAYLGRKDDALREGRRAVELCPESVDAVRGPSMTVVLAEIHARLGEPAAALALIGPLLTKPGNLTLQELRLRWQWDPLRGDARFQKILKSPEPKTVF